ncbi:MAG: C25 family cysteine peptidase [bacterium]|nr:C25 family cysteine peptidase [bacterium]
MLKILYAFILILVLPFSLQASEIVETVVFSRSGLCFSKLEGYDVVRLKNYGSTVPVGSPQLPQVPFSFVIPPGATAEKIEVISVDSEIIPGNYRIYPAQPWRPISFDIDVPFVKPDSVIYNSTIPFPGKIVELAGTGSKSGFRIAGIRVYPIQYIPSKGELMFYSRITLRIIYKENTVPIETRTKEQLKVFGKEVKALVENPFDVCFFSPPIKEIVKSEEYQYVIITSSTLAPIFQSLANWKTKKGVPATIVTTDWIYNNYSGYDSPEKIRNFIKYANENWGSIYFLLGGQADFENNQEVVPRRDVWFWDCGGPAPYPDEDTIPCDLYYSDLDGTWDYDGDHIYGEIEDSVDLYADVYVGRAPSYTTFQCSTFVNKVLTYEKNAPPSYLKKIALVSVWLMWIPPDSMYTGDIVSDAIAEVTPMNWQDEKLYQTIYGLPGQLREMVIDSINTGSGFVHFATHGRPTEIRSIPPTFFWLDTCDIHNMTNEDRLGIHNAIACYTGALDEVPNGDCFAEQLVNHPGGGAVAAIMNSRYGAGRPGGMGISELLDLHFYEKTFNDNLYHLGQAHAASKDVEIPSIDTLSGETIRYVWRFCIYCLNVFGDPELPMWTDEPRNLKVKHPSEITLGLNNFEVRCSDFGPIPNACVCLVKGNDVYATGTTDASGSVTLNISPNSPGTLWVTVTAHNFYPYEGICTVISECPYVCYNSHRIDDSIGGNGDGCVNPGESIEMKVVLKNLGNKTSFGVKGILGTTDSFITDIQDTIQVYGNISPNDTAMSSGSYGFTVSLSTPDEYIIHFELTITDDSNNLWIDTIDVAVSTSIGIEESYKSSITSYRLFQSYPNPFTGITEIRYGLPKDSHINITIYNFLGQRIATLVNENKEAGYHHIELKGDKFAKGIYFIQLKSGRFETTSKLIILE